MDITLLPNENTNNGLLHNVKLLKVRAHKFRVSNINEIIENFKNIHIILYEKYSDKLPQEIGMVEHFDYVKHGYLYGTIFISDKYKDCKCYNYNGRVSISLNNKDFQVVNIDTIYYMIIKQVK